MAMRTSSVFGSFRAPTRTRAAKSESQAMQTLQSLYQHLRLTLNAHILNNWVHSHAESLVSKVRARFLGQGRTRQAALERHNKNTQSPSSRTRTQRGDGPNLRMLRCLKLWVRSWTYKNPEVHIFSSVTTTRSQASQTGESRKTFPRSRRKIQISLILTPIEKFRSSCKSPLCSDDKHPTLDTLDAIAILVVFGDGRPGVRGHGIGPVDAIVKFFRVHAYKAILIANYLVQTRSHHLPCSLVPGHAFDLEGADQHLHLVRRLHRNVHPRL